MSARIEGIVARLHGLHPRLIDLSLDRLLALLEKLGNPHLRLPPVIHVAGTNGKGSTCAFLRAMAEAAGHRVSTSTPRRTWCASTSASALPANLVSDAALAAALEHVEQVNAGAPITVFEVITAVAFHPVRRDARRSVRAGSRARRPRRRHQRDRRTRPPCAITSISLDHRELLGDTLGG